MTARVEYRVVVERDGQQWFIPTPYSEPTTDRGAADAMFASVLENVVRDGNVRIGNAFIVHREVLEAPWIGPDGHIWDEQAARDRMLEKANERRYG